MATLAFFGGFVGIVVLIVISSVWNGYVLSILWGWFMVPVFHLPQLAVVPAIGIAIMVSYLTHQVEPDYEKKERSAGAKIVRDISIVILKPLFALFFGWIVHLFM